MTTYLKLAFFLAIIPFAEGASASTPSSYFPWEWQQIDIAIAGASGSAVTAVVVDEAGSVWVGTHSGLAAYTHHEWQLFRTETSPLPDNDIQQLATTPSGEICIRTAEAIATLRGSKWTTVDVQRLGPPRTMAVAADGTLWAIGQTGDENNNNNYTLGHLMNGVWTYRGVTHKGYITRLLVQPDSVVLVGTLRGLYKLDSNGSATGVPEFANLNESVIDSLALDRRGTLWIGASRLVPETHQLWSYSAGKLRVYDKTNSDLPSGNVSDIVVDNDGSIWALTTKHIVFTGLSLLNIHSGTYGIVHIVDADNWEVATAQNSNLPDQVITAIAPSPSGVWVGTRVGLRRGQRSRTSLFEINQRVDLGEELLDIKVAEDGSVWCLTNFALRVLPPTGKPFASLIVENSGQFGGTAIAISSDKRILWVLFGGDLYRIDSRSPRVPKKMPIKVKDGSIEQGILVNKNGDVIFGETNKLSKLTYEDGTRSSHLEVFELKAPEFESTDEIDDYLSANVRWLVEDSHSGALAIGGKTGFDICHGVDCVYYGKDKLKLPDVSVNSLVFAQDGSLWVGLGSSLVHVLDRDRMQTYSGRYASAVALAGDKSVWIGSGLGLAHLRVDEKSWEVYDGGNSKLPGDIQAIDFASDGSLWVGGRQGGIAHFRPPNTKPEVVLLANAATKVTEREHTFGIVPFDPAFETKVESFRYHWTIKRLFFFGHPDLVADQYASTPFQKFRLDDGSYTLNVVAIDRYGIESKPFSHDFQVAVPSDNPWAVGAKKALTSGAALYLISFVVLLAMIPFYDQYGWVRTAINSGVFSKYSLLHKTILNTPWARRYIFRSAVNLASATAVPENYIPQTLRFGADEVANTSATDSAQVLQLIFHDAKSAILIAKSGSGKSVFLRYLLRERSKQFVAGEANELPILINLRTDWAIGQSICTTIKNIVSGSGVELPLDVMEFLLAKGGFLILFDSLNEVESASAKGVLNPFLTSNSGNRVLFASQIDSLQRPQTRVIGLDIVTEGEARKYMAAKVGPDMWDLLPPETKNLAQNPQNLELLCETLVATNHSQVPVHRADLYRSIVDQDSALMPLMEDVRINAVYRLAETMFEEFRYSLRLDEVNELLNRFNVDAQTVIEAIRKSRSFHEENRRNVVGLNEITISFAHEMIGKYLAARHLRILLQERKPEISDRIWTLAADQRFEDIFRLIVDELANQKDITLFMNILLDHPTQSHLKITAYAIATKPQFLVEKQFIDRFTEAQVVAQAGLPPDAR